MSGYPAGGWLPQELDLDAMDDGSKYYPPSCGCCLTPGEPVGVSEVDPTLELCAACMEQEAAGWPE